MYFGESQVTLSDTSKDYYLQRAHKPKYGRYTAWILFDWFLKYFIRSLETFQKTSNEIFQKPENVRPIIRSGMFHRNIFKIFQ